jgi:5-methylcytosine-specific restriction endonuclease McrA
MIRSFPKNNHVKLNPSARRKLALEVYERDGWACVHCGRTNMLTLMHKEHSGMGGGKGPGDTLENCETGCMICHDEEERCLNGRRKK